MDKFDRIFQLHAILRSRRTPVSLEVLMARLECSRATLYRAVNALKDQLNAPIVFDAEAGGFLYQRSIQSETYELPGLWFSARELQALAIMRRLLKDAGGGLLEEHLGTLSRRLDELTQHQRLNLGEAEARLRFPAIAARPAGEAFGTVANATLQRKQLWIEYHARSTNAISDRTLSPQRIVHYREGWFLDAWDDDKDALRSFAIDRIRKASVLEKTAYDVPEAELDEHYASSYGIFGGKADKIAVLVFTAEHARWVADEQWHPQQQGRWLPDGRYELKLPYREPRELVMDILRHGAGVAVAEPDTLAAAVRAELAKALQAYT
jgi:predicted DNA-binding transcriptional regulator YafY